MNQEILNHFRKVDPKIYVWIEKYQQDLNVESSTSDNYFYKLCRSIAFQQLSGKAATTIWNRFESLLEVGLFKPESVLKVSTEQMRACGLSNAKASYIHNIAQAFAGDANYKNLANLSNDEIIELLTKIKGVGKWTAEMFLMVTLGREDVFSAGDWGLIKGLMKVYALKQKPTKKKIEQITNKWRPYSTYASMALWRAVDGD